MMALKQASLFHFMPEDHNGDIAQILGEVLDHVIESSLKKRKLHTRYFFNVYVLPNFQWQLLVSPSQGSSFCFPKIMIYAVISLIRAP